MKDTTTNGAEVTMFNFTNDDGFSDEDFVACACEDDEVCATCTDPAYRELLEDWLCSADADQPGEFAHLL